LIRSERLNGSGNFLDNAYEFGRFSRRDPGKLKATGFDPHHFHQILKQGEFAPGVVITFQVMAFTGMSPGYPDAVSAFPHGCQKKLWIHPAGARNPYHPDVGRVLHPADTGEIGGTVAAPVAQKSRNFRFPIRHGCLSPYFRVASFGLRVTSFVLRSTIPTISLISILFLHIG
jgi:hypothetical protein